MYLYSILVAVGKLTAINFHKYRYEPPLLAINKVLTTTCQLLSRSKHFYVVLVIDKFCFTPRRVSNYQILRFYA